MIPTINNAIVCGNALMNCIDAVLLAQIAYSIYYPLRCVIIVFVLSLTGAVSGCFGPGTAGQHHVGTQEELEAEIASRLAGEPLKTGILQIPQESETCFQLILIHLLPVTP